MEPVRFENMIDVFDLSRVTPEDRTGAQAAVRSSHIHFFLCKHNTFRLHRAPSSTDDFVSNTEIDG